MPFFSVGLVILLSQLINSWNLSVISCLKNLSWIFLGLRVGICRRFLGLKSTARVLGGWAWNEIQALPLPWFSGSAVLLELVESTGVWPQGLLDAKIAKIPKADGDSNPPLGRSSVCSQLCTGCGPPFGLDIFGSGLKGGCPSRFFVLVMVYLRWKPGFQLLWISRRFFPGLVGDQLHVMVADVIKSSDTVDRSILDCSGSAGVA